MLLTDDEKVVVLNDCYEWCDKRRDTHHLTSHEIDVLRDEFLLKSQLKKVVEELRERAYFLIKLAGDAINQGNDFEKTGEHRLMMLEQQAFLITAEFIEQSLLKEIA